MAADRMSTPRLVPCPSTETVLLDDGTLLLLPVRGGEQLQVDAPWGRMVHDVVVLGRPVDECVTIGDRELFDATLRHLATNGRLLPAERVAAVDVERYDRQVRWFAQEGIDGPEAQRRLALSTVLIIGVGGFGAAMAEMLARAGVGTMALVDIDRVEEENLPRQLLYGDRDIGVRKAFAAANRLEQLAPDLRVVPVEKEITNGEDVARLVRRFRPDIVIGAADRPPISVKSWIDQGAFALGVPVIHGGSRPPYAYVGPMLVPGETPCYECFFRSRSAVGSDTFEREVNALRDANPPSFPSIGWGDITAATLGAGQVVALLTGVHDPAILGREWELDVRTLTIDWMEALPERGDVRCSRCG